MCKDAKNKSLSLLRFRELRSCLGKLPRAPLGSGDPVRICVLPTRPVRELGGIIAIAGRQWVDHLEQKLLAIRT